jgi:hypothetical protein
MLQRSIYITVLKTQSWISTRSITQRSTPTLKGQGRADDTQSQFEDHFKHIQPPIRMWPSPASKCPCFKRLHAILNPPLLSGPSYTRAVTVDKRTLVYMGKPGNLWCQQ